MRYALLTIDVDNAHALQVFSNGGFARYLQTCESLSEYCITYEYDGQLGDLSALPDSQQVTIIEAFLFSLLFHDGGSIFDTYTSFAQLDEEGFEISNNVLRF